MMDCFLLFMLGAAISGFIGYLAWIQLRNKLRSVEDRGVLDDLEFATKDQLLKEFRDRPNNTYILVTPLEKKSEEGLKVELNNCSSHDGLSMIHLAMVVIYKEMKERNMPVPNLPSIEELDKTREADEDTTESD